MCVIGFCQVRRGRFNELIRSSEGSVLLWQWQMREESRGREGRRGEERPLWWLRYTAVACLTRGLAEGLGVSV